jgi:endonuclease/exonuclease/phosphatase family metal-dependent hydrolase
MLGWVALPIVLGVLFFLIIKLSILRYVREHRTTSATDVPARPTRIRLLQYNVFWRPWFGHIGREEYLTERMRDTAAAIKDYDIVCIDEAWQAGSDLVASFIILCRANGFKYILTGLRPKFLSIFILDAGILVLSKFPVAEYEAITFDHGTRIDRLYPKGAIYARIRISTREHIHVVAAHLQATYANSSAQQLAKDRRVRKNQLRQTAELARRHVTDRFPLFVCADMNIDALSGSEYAFFDEVLNIDGFETHDTVCETLGRHPVTYGDVEEGEPADRVLTAETDYGTQQSLDYVFYLRPTEGDAVIAKVESSVEKFKVDRPYGQLSDHYGIATIIELAE